MAINYINNSNIFGYCNNKNHCPPKPCPNYPILPQVIRCATGAQGPRGTTGATGASASSYMIIP